MYRRIGEWKDIQTVEDRQMVRQTDAKTNRPMDGQTERQIDKQMDRMMNEERLGFILFEEILNAIS